MTLKALFLLPIASVPFLLTAQEAKPAEPTAEQVFKDIQVFKGVPAKDLIPAMEFMSASLKKPCTYCHEKDDFSAETEGKEVGRKMVLLQRDINEKWFNGRLSVTCQSCHDGEEHPSTVPLPTTMRLRHQRYQTDKKPEDFFTKHVQSVGTEPSQIKLTGKVTMPSEDHRSTTEADTELIQAKGGKFRMKDNVVFGSDGKTVWRDKYPMSDEPAAIFSRMGRDWRGDDAFAGLDQPFISGKEKIGDHEAIVVRGKRANGSTEELYFDSESGLLVRMLNITPSTIGSVVSVYNYGDYKEVEGVKVPMTLEMIFPDGSTYTYKFTKAETSKTVDDSLFAAPSGGH